MTIREQNIYKRDAKETMAKYGHKIPMKNMILLETGADVDIIAGMRFLIPSYVMFKDSKTGREWQVYPQVYNHEAHTLGTIVEYID